MAYQFLSYPHFPIFSLLNLSEMGDKNDKAQAASKTSTRSKPAKISRTLLSSGTQLDAVEAIEENPFPPDIFRYPPNETVV
jgi:hypothetical protein